MTAKLDAIDKAIIHLTQSGLPLTAHPYAHIAEQLNISETEVMSRLEAMLENKMIRRIAAVPNHYKIGYVANGMSVWNIADNKIDTVGQKVGALPFVSHCYERPRYPGVWDYNLFAMVHGHTKEEVEALVEEISQLLADDNLGHTILFSEKILKKTGIRLKKQAKT